MPSSAEIVAFFHRHLVPIVLHLQKETESHVQVITAFVLSVGEHWFLVTAGHCIRLIEELTTSGGYALEKTELIDSMGINAKNNIPVPIDYFGAAPIALSGQPEYDYGIIKLSHHHVRLLKASGVEPLNEEVWDKQPSQVDFYLMMGVPTQYTKAESSNLAIQTFLVRVTALDSRPEGFPESNLPLFYGQVDLTEDLSSIRGMSGGPVLGFYKDKEGRLRYWLIALQSTTLPISGMIKACPTRILGLYLRNMLDQHEKQAVTEGE